MGSPTQLLLAVAVLALSQGATATDKTDTSMPPLPQEASAVSEASASLAARIISEEGLVALELDSKMEVVNIWAILGIATFLILCTILFEQGKEHVMERVLGQPTAPIVRAIFSELTVLGFLALVTFMLNKFGLSHISTLVYGHAEEDDKAKLGELLEQVHIVIFGIMIVFVFETLWLLMMAEKYFKEWTREEKKINDTDERKQLVEDFEKLHTENPGLREGSFFSVCSPFNSDVAKYRKLKTLMQFMLLRQEFLYQLELQSPKSRTGDSWADFSFSRYQTLSLGERLAEVVELPTRQWVVLELFIVITLCTLSGSEGSWDCLLWMWIVYGWFILLVTVTLWHKVLSVVGKLSHPIHDVSLKEPLQGQDPAKGADSLPGSGEGAGTGGESGEPLEEPLLGESMPNVAGSEASSGEPAEAEAQEAQGEAGTEPHNEGTPLMGNEAGATAKQAEETAIDVVPAKESKMRRSSSKMFQGSRLISSRPEYLEDLAKEKAELDTQVDWMDGELPDRTCSEKFWDWAKGYNPKTRHNTGGKEAHSKGHPKRAYFDLFWLGTNEKELHLFLIRFVCLSLSIYLTVFVTNIGFYVVDAYALGPAVVIIVMAFLPVCLVYGWFLFEVVAYATLATSVEHWRSRKTVSQVMRHQKSTRAINALRFAVSLFLDKEEEEATKKTPRLEDDELDEAMEKAQSVELQRMDELFSKLDKDGSGQLNETEFADLFNQYGLKLDPQRVEAIWDEMTDFQTIEDGSDKKPRQEHLSRGEFLAWILSKEKQASMLDPETFAEKCFKLLDQMGDTSDDLHASMAASSESVASIRDLSDGQISVSEFENGLARLGEKFSSDEVQALILELDVNDDNEFNEEEFMMWVTNHQDQA